MSNKESLSQSYDRFFEARRSFIISPYTSILRNNVKKETAHGSKDDFGFCAGVVGGSRICILLTIIPVLPTMVAVAFVLAAIATLLAYASMPITYSTAEALDYCAGTSMGMK